MYFYVSNFWTLSSNPKEFYQALVTSTRFSVLYPMRFGALHLYIKIIPEGRFGILSCF